MNFVVKSSTIHLHKKMVINQIVKFRSPKDKERCLRKRQQLFIQKQQFIVALFTENCLQTYQCAIELPFWKTIKFACL